jgi:hypothetical protein
MASRATRGRSLPPELEAELEELIAAFPSRSLGLPPKLKAEFEELIAAIPSRSPNEGIAYDPFDPSHPLNNFAYKLLESDKTAIAGLRLFLVVLGTAFARSASSNIKQQVCIALMAFLGQFVQQRVTVDVEALSIFMGLRAEIINISCGQATKFLTAQRTRRRPPQASQDEDLWALASAAVDQLVDGGLTKKEAAKTITTFLRARGFPVPPAKLKSNSTDAERILNWRARLRRTGKRRYARGAYETAKSVIAQANDPLAATEFLIRWMEMTGTKVQ